MKCVYTDSNLSITEDLSASEGFAYKTGDYLAFTDFTKKGLTLSLTASGDWAHDHSYTDGHEDYTFSDLSTLTRDFTSQSSLRKSSNEAIRLKLTSTGENHRLNTYISLTRQAVPSAEAVMNAQYNGRYNGTTERLTSSDSRGLAPTLYANYTLWLPKDQTLDFTASASFGHNKYNSLYSERPRVGASAGMTAQPALASAVTEDNNSIHGNARYYKSWQNGRMLSASLTHDHNHYKDIYAGTSTGDQRLTTDVTMGLLQLSGSTQKYYYYVSAGVSNSAVSLNNVHYNYCVPVAFYGGNYALNQKHSLSLNDMLRGDEYDMSKNIFRVKASVTYLMGDWMLKMNYRSPYTSLDIREPYLIRRRPVYELLASWNHKDWAVEALVRNPFSRYDKQHIAMDYGCYRRDTWNYSEADGCNLNLKLTYSFGYGKKQERGNTEIDKRINSAIMRTY